MGINLQLTCEPEQLIETSTDVSDSEKEKWPVSLETWTSMRK